MSLRFLLRSSNLCQRARILYFGHEGTWSRFFKSTELSRGCEGRNRRFRGQFVAAVTLGFLGLFESSKDDEEKEPEMIMTIKRSIFLIQKGEHKKAEQMLHVALRQAQALQHYDGITYIYDIMAQLAFDMEQNEKAKDLFTSVMQRLMSKGVEENDKKMIDISLKIAKIFVRLKDYRTAEDGFKYCLQHAEEHTKRNPDDEDAIILYGMALDWYAHMLLDVGRYKEALDNYLQAYQWCLKAFGKNHEQTVVVLNDLGTVCCLLGQYDKAIDFLSDGIAIGRQISDPADLSAIYVNLGNVYIKKALYKEANKACTDGLKLAKKSEDKECLNQANNCLSEVNKLLKN